MHLKGNYKVAVLQSRTKIERCLQIYIPGWRRGVSNTPQIFKAGLGRAVGTNTILFYTPASKRVTPRFAAAAAAAALNRTK